MSAPWWDRYPGRLEHELDALREAGIEYKRDEEAFAASLLRLSLKLPTAGRIVDLVAVFPDLYPYFRVEVYGENLGLNYHWNPFGRNLCLLGRRTHAWNEEDTLAKILTQQYPKLLKAASSDRAPEEDGVEQRQAEPYSEYYPGSPSLILVDSSWHIDQRHRSGRLLIGTDIALCDRIPAFPRGAVLEVRSEAGQVLCSADAPMRSRYAGQKLFARWARVPKAIPHADGEFFNHLFRLHPEVRDARANRVERGWLRVWGVLFPEEINYRQTGEGWIFAYLFDKRRTEFGPPRPKFLDRGILRASRKGGPT